jgi:asparagine synthase (glutamine-hydrolysing)
MTDIVRHRGPDDTGLLIQGPVGLGFRRLSILDLSIAGHQPMQTDNGDISIVFNGEIYNYVELRKMLEAKGRRFRSSGDTEVLLNAYLEWGTDCLPQLNGMWAFIIHDRRRRLLFGSRDRFGIKPLFRWTDHQRIIFASEIKSIRASGWYVEQTNLASMAAFLAESRLDETRDTFYDAIDRLPPASGFEVDYEGRYREWRYWNLDEVQVEPCSDPTARFSELFEDSVRLNMRSDVPVAVHLSGGLDSTSIACASARIRTAASASGALMAFCYMDSRFDESRFIQATVAQTQASMVSLDTSPHSLWDSIPQTLWHQDEPVHSMTAMIGYQLMERTARHGVKVILNGQGADETIGGYPSYFRDYWYTLLLTRSFIKAAEEVVRHRAVHGGSASMRLVDLARHALQTWLSRFQRYRELTAWRRRQRIDSTSWLHPDIRALVPERQPTATAIDAVLKRSIESFPLPLYLRVEDRNASAHSVEARVPFLDHRLVSFVLSLPPEWRLRGPWNKYVLRAAMVGRIPEIVRVRADKMGFPTATAAWFRGELHGRVKELLHDPAFRRIGYFDADQLLRMLEQHRKGLADYSDELFKAAQTFFWSQQRGAIC